MEEWTPILWRSLERAREEWGPSLMIHPAHYAGEDERGKDQAIGAAFGPLQESNKPLAMTDLETLTEWIRNKTGSAPDAYRRIKAVNVGLLEVSEEEATELEVGRNECAVG